MNTFQFIASIVESCAWPVAVVGLAFALRRPLVALIGRTTSAEGFGAKLTFAERVEAAREAAEIANAELSASASMLQLPAPNSEVEALSQDMATSSAAGSIVLGWARLERGLRNAAMTLGLASDSPREKTWAQILFANEVIDSGTLGAIRKLKSIRNEVVHNSFGLEPSFPAAQSYNAAVGDVLNTVQRTVATMTQ